MYLHFLGWDGYYANRIQLNSQVSLDFYGCFVDQKEFLAAGRLLYNKCQSLPLLMD